MPKADPMNELIGHNSSNMTETTKEKLRQTVDKIERLEAFGFDVKALRAVIRIRKIEKADREEQEMMLELYMMALGIL